MREICIILCEDDHDVRARYQRYISNYLTKKGIGKICLSTDSPEEVLAYVRGKDDHAFMVYFLDIQLGKNKDGMALAGDIRRLDQMGEIVFITSFEDYISKSFQYKLKALDYINKSEDIEERIAGCLDAVINNERLYESIEEDVWTVFEDGASQYRVRLKDVIAFEGSRDHKVKIIGKDRTVSINTSLSAVEEKLEGPFQRIHRSFIINMDHFVRHYRHLTVLMVEMSNGASFPVSRLHAKEIVNRER